MTACNEQVARGMIEVAQRRLLRDYPFHARFVAAWHSQATEIVPTVGVTVRNGRILLFFNPEFVVACSLPELGGVLLHECHHILFGHVFLDPRTFSDANALLIAEETTVNEWIREPLPGNPILLSQYPQLPAGEDTETRYRRLAQDPEQRKRGDRYQKILSAGLNSVPLEGKTGPQPANSDRLQPLDDHGVWDEGRDAGLVGQLAVRVVLRDTAQALSAEEWERVPAAVRQQVVNGSQADTAGGAVECLRPAGEGCVPWYQLLRRYVREATDTRPVFNRPPRRFPELVGILPGRRREATRARVMAIVDTSGSMCPAVLTMIAAELKLMSRTHAITVVESDTKVQRVYPFRGTMEHVRGRGGTDLCPPFDQALLAKVRPDVIICFTDGCGPAPDRPPQVPVIWCLSPGGQKPADWGREITLSVVDEHGERGESYGGPRLTTHRVSPYIRLGGHSRSEREAAT